MFELFNDRILDTEIDMNEALDACLAMTLLDTETPKEDLVKQLVATNLPDVEKHMSNTRTTMRNILHNRSLARNFIYSALSEMLVAFIASQIAEKLTQRYSAELLSVVGPNDLELDDETRKTPLDAVEMDLTSYVTDFLNSTLT